MHCIPNLILYPPKTSSQSLDIMTSMMPKQLAQFLKEQQEPFFLEDYLLERGCCYRTQKNRFHSSYASSCYCSTMSKPSSRLKRSVIWGLNKNPKFVPDCSKVVRALFTKLLTVHNIKKLGNGQIRPQNTCVADIDKGRQENDAHLSPESSTAHHQESPDFVYVLTENEVQVVADWKCRWRNPEEEEESKQLSPVSVLEQKESYSDSPPVGEEGMKKLKGKGELKKSDSRFQEKPIYNYKGRLEKEEEEKEFVASKSNPNINNNNNNVSSHHSKNKKAVQQTKQLLFDCIREVLDLELEKHNKKESSGGQQQLKGILGLGGEQLWELICQNLCLWSKESINETNINHLLQSESEVVLVSAQKWSDLERQTQVIGSQLGDAILEDICNEIIVEMR